MLPNLSVTITSGNTCESSLSSIKCCLNSSSTVGAAPIAVVAIIIINNESKVIATDRTLVTDKAVLLLNFHQLSVRDQV